MRRSNKVRRGTWSYTLHGHAVVVLILARNRMEINRLPPTLLTLAAIVWRDLPLKLFQPITDEPPAARQSG